MELNYHEKLVNFVKENFANIEYLLVMDWYSNAQLFEPIRGYAVLIDIVTYLEKIFIDWRQKEKIHSVTELVNLCVGENDFGDIVKFYDLSTVEPLPFNS